MWLSREDWMKYNTTEPYPEGIAEIIVAKNRNGPTGNMPCHFDGGSMYFTELELTPVA